MELISSLFGGGNSDAVAQEQANQRRSLAQLASQQGELDQAAATGSSRARGGRLLTFVNSGSLSGRGQSTLG